MATTGTTKETRVESNGGANGHSSRLRDFVLTPPTKRLRLRDLAIGATIVGLFAFGGLLWHLSAVEKVPALSVAVDLDRGDVIERGDLRTVYVGSDQPLARIAPEMARTVVGRTAAVPLRAGMLLTKDLVIEPAVTGPDDGIVGLLLEPGQYPTSDLAPGDVVDIMSSATVVGRGAVVDVRDLAGADRKLVSVIAPKDSAAAIAGVDQSSVRLVWVAAP